MGNTNISFDFAVREVLAKTPKYVFESAWLEHGPFMIWLVKQLQPKVFVELGTHYGYSYFAGCQAIAENDLETKAFAVDTWEGDSQAGIYGNEVFEKVSNYNDENYSEFSSLLRMTFSEALDNFPDNSIDLLHIDGFHSYDAVFLDFNSWKIKLSKKSIVIFHDINVFAEGFGVYKFWNEIKADYPSFEFLHGHGLGIIKYGNEFTEVDFLFDKKTSESERDKFRELISSIAARKTIDFQLAQKDEIINMYYSKLMNQIKLNEQNLEKIKVLNQIIEDIKSSKFWRLTRPLQKLNRFLRFKNSK